MHKFVLPLLLALAPLSAAAHAPIDALTLIAPRAPAPTLGTERLLLALEEGFGPDAALEEAARRDELSRAEAAGARARLVRAEADQTSSRVLLAVPTTLFTLASFALVDVMLTLPFALFVSERAGIIAGLTLAPLVQAAGAGAVYLGGRWLGGQGSYWTTYLAGLGASIVFMGASTALGSGAELYLASDLTAVIGVPVATTVAMIVAYESSSTAAVRSGELVGRASREERAPRLFVSAAPRAGGGGLVAGASF